MSVPLRDRLKRCLAQVHSLINRSELLATIYLRVCATVIRSIAPGPLKSRVVANLSLFAWRPERLAPVETRIAGASVTYKLVPHPGMLDFQSMFHREFEYEPEVVSFLEKHLAQVDNVIEIGANVGLYTLFFSRHLAQRKSGQVFAFEPATRTHAALLDNLRVNHADNVVPFKAAVFVTWGVATFYEPVVAAFGYRDLTRSSLVKWHASWNAAEVREYQVLTVGPDCIESLLEDRGRVLIKLDIEGAEHLVLKALEGVLRRYQPALVMEVLPQDCDRLNAIGFVPLEYRLLHLTDRGPVEHPRFVGDPACRFKDYLLLPRTT